MVNILWLWCFFEMTSAAEIWNEYQLAMLSINTLGTILQLIEIVVIICFTVYNMKSK
ncbi:ORF116 [Plodia interpunctella granulovirus]|uniref:ORF116 n=1 Tax=Plodia interpunctella granulovirus TaxID=262175 RepID=A0A1L5JHI9_9BBAC|nr:ORF116 [Plodia interpunctella granulovirus]APO14000.1 ORF116 [Plodia interpunctella granulovirus]